MPKVLQDHGSHRRTAVTAPRGQIIAVLRNIQPLELGRAGAPVLHGRGIGPSRSRTGVFGDLLPEFRNLRPPRLLRTDEAAALPVRDHVGRYGQARTVVEVTLDDQGALHLGVAPRNQDVAATSRLRAADRGVFLAESRGNPEFQFVQFIADEASPGTAYLWNGRQIWRREPDPR